MNKKEKDRQSLNKNRKVLSAKAQDEEMCGIITKTTMGVIFFIQNSQVLTYSLPTEEIYSGTRKKSIQVHGQNRPVTNLPVVNFLLNREKCLYQSNFRFFFSYFGFLPLLGKFERHCL